MSDFPAMPKNLIVYGGQAAKADWLSAVRNAVPDTVEILNLSDSGKNTAAIDSPIAALQFALADQSTLDCVLIKANLQLPSAWWPRLLQIAAAAPDAQVVSPLGNAEPELSPWFGKALQDCDDVDAIDAGCFMYGTRSWFASDYFLPSLSFWRVSQAQFNLALGQGHKMALHLNMVASDTMFVLDADFPCVGCKDPSNSLNPLAANPLSILWLRFSPLLNVKLWQADAKLRPVILHILHGWGGGAEVFVRDLAVADQQNTHLILIAKGNSVSEVAAQSMVLMPAVVCDTNPLREYPLPQAIVSTSCDDLAYAATLKAVIEEFDVKAIVLSSLIGHDLSCLRTQLPTFVVTHDYYPFWPLLHENFDDSQLPFDQAQLVQSLNSAEKGWPFGRRDAEFWMQLRERYAQALVAANALMIFPNQSVQKNLHRMQPSLGALEGHVIAHGLRDFPSLPRPCTAPTRTRLRVLVLGRINGGKGMQVLPQLIAQMAGELEFYLLGCGKQGEAFFAQSHVHIQLNYQRDELPELIQLIRPDFAILPVSVAETFSFTLSELWALGVVPIASALGSLKERIEHQVNGFLCAPTAMAFTQQIRTLLAQPELLQTVSRNLAQLPVWGSQQMCAQYQSLFAQARLTPRVQEIAAISAQQLEFAEFSQSQIFNSRGLLALSALQKHTGQELKERTDWAFEMESQFNQRTEWANQLQAESNWLKGQLSLAEEKAEKIAKKVLDFPAEFAHLKLELSDREQELQSMRNSYWWRLIGPLRKFTAILRRLRKGLLFRVSRFISLFRRGVSSVRQRGIVVTWRKLLGEVKPALSAKVKIAVPDLLLKFAPFQLPCSESPKVSIIIPAYNHFDHTLACLRSFALHPSSLPIEIIVVDDFSTDQTQALLPQIGGVRYHRNAQNMGFIGSCNAGAQLAKGEFVVFLNNDTAVSPRWLEALLYVFDSFPDTGMAGAKLIYPDGRLQEAGGIVFSDASGWNYGRFQDPEDSAYSYVREVDYCSGAAIMLRLDVFRELGGFDTRYKPAYYEDTDLAFALRERGLKVRFQPASQVIHFEGVSSGTDTSTGIKKYQVVNQRKFFEKWQSQLRQQPNPGTPIFLAREHRYRGRVLIVDACTPTPDQDSGSVRMINLMRVLMMAGWKITFLAENRQYLERYTSDLQQLGVEVLYAPWNSNPVTWLSDHGAVLDAVILSRHYVAVSFLPLIREYAPKARVIFDTVDLHYLREQRAAAIQDRKDVLAQAQQTRKQELKLVRESDITLVVSPVEQELLRAECPGSQIDVLSNVHEVAGPGKSFADRKDIWFVGGFQHTPNIDAVQWFVAEIWPTISAALSGVQFHIVGSRMPDSIKKLTSDSVIVHGFVESVADFLDGCRIAVAPLRFGAGVKGKVNQSMAHGQAVVSTSIGVEGMHIIDRYDVLVADDAQAFAQAVIALYRDQLLWNKLAENGLANIEAHFSFAAAQKALARIMPAI